MKNYELSVLIPARCEEFLGQTIADVLKNSRARTQVVALCDGEWPMEPIEAHEDLTLIYRPVSIGQRAATNECARIASGTWIMKLDAHCMVGEGFDRILIDNAEYQNTYVPRMFNLHVFDWECQGCKGRSYQGPEPDRCGHCKGTDFKKIVVWHPRDGQHQHWTCEACTYYTEEPKKPTACPTCGGEKFAGCGRRVTDSMRFDSDLHFQYFRDFNLTADEVVRANQRNEERGEPYRHVYRPNGQGRITETMSLIGACWFLHRDRFFELGGLDEDHGSWGQMGTELACATWLSGGRLLCNRKTWFAHLFRTQPGFSFPYQQSQNQINHARVYSQDLWRNNKWPKAVRPFSWILEHFWPIPGWSEADLNQIKAQESATLLPSAAVVNPTTKDAPPRPFVSSGVDTGLTKGIVYYTENRLQDPVRSSVQKQLLRSINGHQLVSVSLKPMDFGDNIVLGLEPGYLTMFKQILAGLAHLDTDLAFLCEHDCLYPAEHFQFTPPRKDRYYYNENLWRVSAKTGQTLFHYRRSVLGLCADRRLLIEHYGKRIAKIEEEGFQMRNGFEPGTRSTKRYGYDDLLADSWFSTRPIVDIRDTGKNATRTMWTREEFRNPRVTVGWTEGDSVPGWPGLIKGRFEEWLAETIGDRL